MGVIEFVENYSDLSTDQGYQFRFHCNHCGNGYESTYVANKLNMAGDFLRAASGLFGGALGNVGNTAYQIQQAVGGPAHDAALHNAVTEIKPLFNQCTRCGTWVCKQVCWNPEKELCKRCAPVLGEEAAAAEAEAMVGQLQQKAMMSDQTHGIDLSQERIANCHNCGAAVGASKFCPECGTPVVREIECSECHTHIAPGVKFCPECGTKV